MTTYYEYTAVRGDQTSVSGNPVDYAYAISVGSTWRWSGGTTSFVVREADNGNKFHGDPDNEIISPEHRFGGAEEQVVVIDGTAYQAIWDYTFEVSRGGNTWRVGVIDVDLNGNNQIDLGSAEQGYFLVFPDGFPPSNRNLTVGNVIENDNETSHPGLGAEQVVCFAAGTLIATDRGAVPVEKLNAGDRVLTRDHGYQPLRWTGRKQVAASGHLAPIVFRKGAIGNSRDLAVSPQHRMLVSDWRAELLFGEGTVLVRAKDMVDGADVYVAEGGLVSYHHIMFDRHEIVFAEGVPSESFQPGDQSLNGLEDECKAELLELFPELESSPETAGPSARMSLKGYEAALLAA